MTEFGMNCPHALPDVGASVEESAAILMSFPLYVMWCFSMVLCRILLFCMIFCLNCNMMWSSSLILSVWHLKCLLFWPAFSLEMGHFTLFIYFLQLAWTFSPSSMPSIFVLQSSCPMGSWCLFCSDAFIILCLSLSECSSSSALSSYPDVISPMWSILLLRFSEDFFYFVSFPATNFQFDLFQYFYLFIKFSHSLYWPTSLIQLFVFSLNVLSILCVLSEFVDYVSTLRLVHLRLGPWLGFFSDHLYYFLVSFAIFKQVTVGLRCYFFPLDWVFG